MYRPWRFPKCPSKVSRVYVPEELLMYLENKTVFGGIWHFPSSNLNE